MFLEEVLPEFRKGKRITRTTWNGKGMWIKLKDDSIEMDRPYAYIFAVDGKKSPWLCSQTDLLADDWVVV